MHYSTFIFDLDNTLLDFSFSENAALKYIHQKYVSHINYQDFVDVYHEINRPLWLCVERGETTPREIGYQRFKLLLEQLAIKHIDYLHLAHEYEAMLGSHCLWCCEHAKPFLNQLKPSKNLAVITNGLTRVQEIKYTSANLADYFPLYIISEKAGYAKPDKRIFEGVFAHFNVSREDCLMIGDSLGSDGLGAKNAGMDFCWYNPTSKNNHINTVQPRYTIQSFETLIKLIK